MEIFRKSVLVALCFLTTARAGDWIMNGDFEQKLCTGWSVYKSGPEIIIERMTNYDPDPDYEVQAYKGSAGGNGSNGYIRIFQIINIPATDDFEFSANLKLYAYDNNADSLTYAASALIIGYYNGVGDVLGETRICQFTDPCPWQNTATCHLIYVNDSLWHSYNFNLNGELGNLPGVNPSEVKKIGIALYDTTAHTC